MEQPKKKSKRHKSMLQSKNKKRKFNPSVLNTQDNKSDGGLSSSFASNRSKSSIDSLVQDLTSFKESRVSKQFSELTTKRIIILVLLIITIEPLFEVETYFSHVPTADYSLNLLSEL